MPLGSLRGFLSIAIATIIFLNNNGNPFNMSFTVKTERGSISIMDVIYMKYSSKRWLQSEPSHNGGRHRNHTMPDSSSSQNNTIESNETHDSSFLSSSLLPTAWRSLSPSNFPNSSFSSPPSISPSSPNFTSNTASLYPLLNTNFTQPSFIAPFSFNNSNISLHNNITLGNETLFELNPPIFGHNASHLETKNNDTNATIINNSKALTNSSAQIQGWNGCEDPGSNGSVVKKGKPTTVCISVSGGGDWSLGIDFSRWFYKPIADEYSHFTVTNSFRDLVLSENPYQDEVSVHVASQDAVSFIRRYFDEAEGKIYPYLTAILDVTDGVVNGIAWDDACVRCKDNKRENNTRCEENTYDFTGNLTTLGTEKTKGCYYTKEECVKFQNQNNNICDLNIYFVWTGSDINGRILSSSGSRWSAFSFIDVNALLNKFQ